MLFGWGHGENDIERTLRDEPRDFNGYVRMNDSLPQMNQAPNQPYDVDGSTSDPNVGVTSTTTPRVSNSDDSVAIGRFLEETGLLSSGEQTMSLAEMCAFSAVILSVR